MDPLAALQAEIKKRKTVHASSKQSARWRSHAEIEREREADYYRRQRAIDVEREAKRRRRDEQRPSALAAKLSSSHEKRGKSEETEGDRRITNTANSLKVYEQASDDDSYNIDEETENPTDPPPLRKEDVIRKLRALRQPATLFGEDEWARFNRLREVQISIEDQTEGQDNIYQKKMREVRAKDAAEDAKLYVQDEENGEECGGAAAKNIDSEDIASDGVGEDDVNCVLTNKEAYVGNLIRKYMRFWNGELEGMSKEERRSNKGRSQIATYEQTKEWLKPLDQLLINRKLSKAILDALVEIFQAAVRREYMQAMRLYFERLAIGNAPWPMGATQVGIHSRVAREKIGEDKIAHVMNDEQTRKYIQAVKRLLTVAQRHSTAEAS